MLNIDSGERMERGLVGWMNGRRSVARSVASSRSRKPLARSEELVIEELGDELLVYDESTHRAHCLSATAARVWRACDGQRTPDALCAELGLDAGSVSGALAELADCQLFDTGPRLQGGNGLSRRDFGVKAAKVGAVAASAPLVWSVAVPPAAGAITPTPAVCAGYNNKSCDSCACVIGCCCCCQGLGNCKFCAPSATCPATGGQFCGNPHCSTERDIVPAGIDCEDLPADCFGGGCPACCGCSVLPGAPNCTECGGPG